MSALIAAAVHSTGSPAVTTTVDDGPTDGAAVAWVPGRATPPGPIPRAACVRGPADAVDFEVVASLNVANRGLRPWSITAVDARS